MKWHPPMEGATFGFSGKHCDCAHVVYRLAECDETYGPKCIIRKIKTSTPASAKIYKIVITNQTQAHFFLPVMNRYTVSAIVPKKKPRIPQRIEFLPYLGASIIKYTRMMILIKSSP